MNHPNHSMLHRPLLRRGLTVRVTNTRAVHATHHTHNTLVTAYVGYTKKQSVLRKLPSWIGERTTSAVSFGTVVKELRSFFKAHE